MQDIDKLIEELFSRQRAGIKPGLERTYSLLEVLGNPHENLKCIHIAGTNGKGTCSALFASYYKEKGYKVGLYTSPHILEFNERIRVDTEKISNEKIVEIYKKLENKIEELDATFFEITTVIAFQYFAESDCDICVIETGMGGRFDSTNVVMPALSAITSISYDHKEYLGDTIEKIAFEKGGIIKKNTPVIIGKLPSEALEVVKQKANEENAKIISYEDLYEELKLIDEKDFKTQYEYINYKFFTSLIGEHNRINLSLIIRSLIELDDFKIDVFIKSLANLNANTGYFGRLSVLNRNPYFIIDTAHNEEAILNNINTILKQTENKFSIVYTGMKDKDNLKNIELLRPICNKMILTKTAQLRNESLENLEKYCSDCGIENYVRFDNISASIQYALEENQDTIVIGSFFLISEVIEYLNTINYGSIGLASFSKS